MDTRKSHLFGICEQVARKGYLRFLTAATVRFGSGRWNLVCECEVEAGRGAQGESLARGLQLIGVSRRRRRRPTVGSGCQMPPPFAVIRGATYSQPVTDQVMSSSEAE
jgi:hypothetical protein